MVEPFEEFHGCPDALFDLAGPDEVAADVGHVRVHGRHSRGLQMVHVAVDHQLRFVQVKVQAPHDQRVLALEVLHDQRPLQEVAHHHDQLENRSTNRGKTGAI